MKALAAFIVGGFVGGMSAFILSQDEGIGIVVVENREMVPISGRISVCGENYFFPDVQPDDYAIITHPVHCGESSYTVNVTYGSGERSEVTDGYVTSGVSEFITVFVSSNKTLIIDPAKSRNTIR